MLLITACVSRFPKFVYNLLRLSAWSSPFVSSKYQMSGAAQTMTPFL